MYKSLFTGICLFALTACGSGVDQSGDPGVNPIPDGTTNSIPEDLSANLQSATYNASAQTLQLQLTALDETPLVATYLRTPGLDIGPYQAYTVQDDPLDRHFTALVAQSGDPDQSVRAGVVSDGGQFNRYYHGGFYERDGTFTPPAAISGLVSYAGTYAGVTNASSGGAGLLPVPPGVDPALLPAQSARTNGDIFLNVDFNDNAVNGAITNRVLTDFALDLPDIVLVEGVIDDTGVFAGSTEYDDQTANGTFGGIFGGTNAGAVGGIVALQNFDGPGDPLGFENEREHGVFVLIQCGLPGDDPICDNVN